MRDYPVRQRPPNPKPPPREFLRKCNRCKADFGALAPGKTGERGLWAEGMNWFCSQECFDLGGGRLPSAKDRPERRQR